MFNSKLKAQVIEARKNTNMMKAEVRLLKEELEKECQRGRKTRGNLRIAATLLGDLGKASIATKALKLKALAFVKRI